VIVVSTMVSVKVSVRIEGRPILAPRIWKSLGGLVTTGLDFVVGERCTVLFAMRSGDGELASTRNEGVIRS
jgi:hypothetical protein